MKRLLIGLMAFGLCTQQVNAMQMDQENKADKKERSCTDTCSCIIKGCCLLSAAYYVMLCAQQAQEEVMIFDDNAMPDKQCTMRGYKTSFDNRFHRFDSSNFIVVPSQEYCSDDGKNWWRRRDYQKTPSACSSYQQGECELEIAAKDKDKDPYDDYL